MTNEDRLVTKGDLKEFYDDIMPYLGGMPAQMVSKFNRSDLYSTDEKIVGCWTDGRPIYQKTYEFTTPSANSTGNIVTNLVNISIKNIEAIVYSGTVQAPVPWNLEYAEQSKNGGYIFLDTNANALKYICGSSFANAPGVATIRYTKTTDSANSFNYGSETDYSTTEKIIGTWIDGKYIYQKTINCGAMPNTTRKTVAHGISNLNRVVQLIGIIDSDTLGIACNIDFSSSERATDNAELYIQNTDIVLKTASDLSEYNAYVTIQYTKTS